MSKLTPIQQNGNISVLFTCVKSCLVALREISIATAIYLNLVIQEVSLMGMVDPYSFRFRFGLE